MIGIKIKDKLLKVYKLINGYIFNKKDIMNAAEKGKRYDELLNQHKQVEVEIGNVPKIPLDTVLQDVNSVEYTPHNQVRINELRTIQEQINSEVARLFQ